MPSPSKLIEYPLLENGLDFLDSAVDHLRDEPSERDLKYAVLHLASGTELVLKERLRRKNPALLYQHPEKFDEADFDAGNFSSANAKEAVKRLVEDAGVTVSDRHRNQLHLLREMRNRIEHFGMNDTEEAVLATTARGLAFAVDFIGAELSDETLGAAAAEYLQRIREALPELSSFVASRWKQVGRAVREATTAVVTCSRCGEEAAVLDDGARCLFCGFRVGAEAGADEHAHVVVGVSRYEMVKDGADWVVSYCPDCEREALVDQGVSGGMEPGVRWVCFGCGNQWDERGLWACDICGAWTPSGEGEMTVCSSCFQWRVSAPD